jgi:hypothetical protein
MITGGGALPLGYATGGASALGLVNSTTGGLALTTDQMGSWMVMGQPNNHVQMHIPQLLPGGEQRLSINNNQPPGVNDSQAYAQAQSQANALSQLHTLQRLAALNRVSPHPPRSGAALDLGHVYRHSQSYHLGNVRNLS